MKILQKKHYQKIELLYEDMGMANVRFPSLTLFFFLCGSGLTAAVTSTWTGMGGDTWINPSNWNPALPNGMDDTAIFNGQSPHMLSLGGAIEIGTLTFTNAGTYHISDNTFTLSFSVNSESAAINVETGAVNPSIVTAISLSSPLSLNIGDGLSLNIGGDINGSSTLTNAGQGSVFLSGTNGYTGITTIQAGTLALIGTGSIHGDVNITTGGIFDISGGTGGSSTIGNLSGDSTATIHLGNQSLSVGAGQATSFDGVIQGEGNFSVGNGATLTLTNVNTYTGEMIAFFGNIIFSGNGSVFKGSTLSADSGFVDISGINADGMQVGDLNGNNQIILGSKTLTFGTVRNSSFDGNFSGVGGSLVKTGTGRVGIGSVPLSYTGLTTVNQGTLSIGQPNVIENSSGVVINSEGLLFVDANQSIQNFSGSGKVELNAGDLTVTPTSVSNTFSGVISGAGSFTLNGPNSLLFEGENTYTGGTTIGMSGTLSLSGNGSLVFLGALDIPSGTFDISGISPATSTQIGDLTGSGNIVLGANTLIFGTSNPSSFSGNISGSGGSLNKIGSGIFTLESAASYTGSTTVGDGTFLMAISDGIAHSTALFVDSGAFFDLNSFSQTINDLSGMGQITLGSGNLTVHPSSLSTSFDGAISGTGGLTKEGFSELILTGANIYTGPTSINGGALKINGSITSDVTVNPLTELTGIGTIHGAVDLKIGSFLVPGNSIGTLTVDSALFEAGSQFLIDLNSAGASSSLVATGASGISVTAGSNILVFPETGTYQGGTTYEILHTTTGTISNGTSFSIVSLNPKFQFHLTENVSDTTVFLVLNKNATLFTIPTATLSGNRLRTANYLNTLDTFLPLDSIFADFFLLTPEETENALDAISPARNAFSTYATEWTAFIFNEVLESRLSNRRLTRPNFRTEQNEGLTAMAMIHKKKKLPPECILVPPKPLSCEQFSAWIAPFGEFAHEKAQKQTPAFNLDAGGVVAGFDWFDLEHVLLGAALGYAFIDVNEKHNFGKAWQSDYTASLYTSLYASHFYADISLWGSYNQIHGKRNVSIPGFSATATSRTHSWQVVPHFDFGYDILYSWGAIEPFASFDWAINMQPSFSEKGAAPLNMHQNAQTTLLMRTELGLSAYQTRKFSNGALLIVRESASYVYKKPFGRNGHITAAIVGAPGGTFFVETLTNSQNLFAPGLEAFYRTRGGAFASLTYEGEFGSGFWSNTLILKAGKEF